MTNYEDDDILTRVRRLEASAIHTETFVHRVETACRVGLQSITAKDSEGKALTVAHVFGVFVRAILTGEQRDTDKR